MLHSLRAWTAIQRSPKTNFQLGVALCFVAGATNAGGFLAVGQYTSHMSGMVSSVADSMVLGHWGLVVSGAAAVLSFLLGAMTTAWMVNWCLRRNLRSAYGRPLLLEALLLLVFGIFGTAIDRYDSPLVPTTVLVLCYIMGLQNAVITKISRSEIRTTHITGLITDLGIELGKLTYVNRLTREQLVNANVPRMRLLLALVGAFFIGGVSGALGFKTFGYISTLPLSALLVMLVWWPVMDDARQWIHSRNS
ncbi:YoaK family protein [uncultured Rhodoferax sp.]|uniref:YoaK family protein n=1 Tax=uncultured Rhodoferax sp. TaxID=223188 RepID=UPI0025E0FCEA|nr:YoaK family protein [uncultured Rhodoferax sp.]